MSKSKLIANERIEEIEETDESILLEPTKLKMLSSKWREANKPDNLLGSFVVAPSPQMVRQTGAMKIIKKLDMNVGCRFIDLGSSAGLVSIAAALMVPGLQSDGIELDGQKVDFANRLIRDLPDDPKPKFWQGDLCVLKSIDEYSHVYTFDKEFPPFVLTAIGRLLMRPTATWQMFVSAKPNRVWSKLFDEQELDKNNAVISATSNGTKSKNKRTIQQSQQEQQNWWDANVELFDKQQGALCGSGEGHMFYIYRRKQQQPLPTNNKVSSSKKAKKNDTVSDENETSNGKRYPSRRKFL